MRKAATKPVIAWKYVVFRWNDRPDVIRTLLEKAQAAGVDYVQLTFARTPWYGISWRFYSPFYRSLARREGRFRNIWLRRPGYVPFGVSLGPITPSFQPHRPLTTCIPSGPSRARTSGQTIVDCQD